MAGKILKGIIICTITIGLAIGLGIFFRTIIEERRLASYSAKGLVETMPEQEVPAPSPTVSEIDFSDLSHWNLTVSAWESLAKKDFKGVFAYARKCLEFYEEKALEAAKSMQMFAQFGHEDDYALVNDVATSHYIMGEAYMKQNMPDEAIREFSLVIEKYPYAQCWDPKGWFWKVAEVSRINIEKINKMKQGD